MAETNGVIKLGKAGRRLDTDAIDKGVWKDCPYHDIRVRIRPAASFNPRFRKAMRARIEDSVERSLGEDAEGSITSWTEDAEFIVNSVVADIDGLYNGEDEPVAYTPEIGVRLLSDPGHIDVREWIVQEATSYQAFYAQTLAKRSGNSRSGSSGKRAGAGRSARTRS